MELTIYHTYPDTVYEALLSSLYPAELLPQKKTEGANRQFFYACIVVIGEDKPLAACCLYHNPALVYAGVAAMAIGNFESHNQKELVDYMLEEATKQAKARGAKFLLGPMNGSTWDTYRLRVESAHPSFFLEPYYHGYYHELLEHAGFSPAARYVSHIDRGLDLNETRIIRAEQSFQKQGICIRSIDLDRYNEELERLHTFCMQAFRENALFTPIDKNAFVEKYLKIKPYIDPAYVLIAEEANKEIVGFIFCLTNFSDTNEKGLIVKTLAKHPSLRYGGMGNVLGTRVMRAALQNGYSYLIHAFMIESNASRSLSDHFDTEVLREYYLYSKAVN